MENSGITCLWIPEFRRSVKKSKLNTPTLKQMKMAFNTDATSMRNLATGCLILAVALLAGCSRQQDKWTKARPKLVSASGIVKLNGTPLDDAVIVFHPVTGTHTAYSRSNASGKFTLTTFDSDDGIVPGEYKVVVTKVISEFIPDDKNPQVAPPLYQSEQSLVNDQYGNAEKTPLNVTIADEKNTDVNLDLTGKPGELKVIVDRRKLK